LSGAALHQRLRVAGDVKAGSIQHLSGRVDFILMEQGKGLPISYVGTDPLPDTFKDGAQCLVEGKVTPDGRFVAETLQASARLSMRRPRGKPSPVPGCLLFGPKKQELVRRGAPVGAPPKKKATF